MSADTSAGSAHFAITMAAALWTLDENERAAFAAGCAARMAQAPVGDAAVRALLALDLDRGARERPLDPQPVGAAEAEDAIAFASTLAFFEATLGRLGLIVVLVGFFAATFGAALETGLSSGYTVAQYFGWPWGKQQRPVDAARFHAVILVSILAAVAVGLTTVDPIKVTEYSIVFSAVALPLTYFPILVVANDPQYMGDKVNSRLSNALASVYLVIIAVAAVAAIPLMVATKAGM